MGKQPKQADANEVIEDLAMRVADLTRENAVLSSIVSQYQKEEEPEVAE